MEIIVAAGAHELGQQAGGDGATAIKNAIADINIGEVGTNITTEKHITVPMLCGRDGGGENTALKREIENRMGTQRMDILQKRYLRDLISDAYIERRV